MYIDQAYLNTKIRDAYANAYKCQDACNSSWIIKSFAKDVNVLWDEARILGKGIEHINKHPVVICYLDKLCSLAGIQSTGVEEGMKVVEALEICRKKMGESQANDNQLEEGNTCQQ